MPNPVAAATDQICHSRPWLCRHFIHKANNFQFPVISSDRPSCENVTLYDLNQRPIVFDKKIAGFGESVGCFGMIMNQLRYSNFL